MIHAGAPRPLTVRADTAYSGRRGHAVVQSVECLLA